MKLKWTRPALQDLKHLYEYIADDDPAAARMMVSRIRKAADNLRKHPHMGKVGRVPQTRELIIAGSPYIVAYFIAPSYVSILAVIHTARRWPDSFPH